jgi:hypothetical protein
MRRMLYAVLALLVVGSTVLLLACTSPRRYTSLDLDLLPCEHGIAPRFFQPIEFDKEGKYVYPSQAESLHSVLRTAPLTDLVFFIHGWNKNPSSAERDYQDFLCRLHARLRMIIGDEKQAQGLLVIGVFWPSTITNQAREPILLKPLSYYQIRDRADLIAQEGLAPLLTSLQPSMVAQRGGRPVRLQLIGHSFGGRMLVRALETLSSTGALVPLLQQAETVNVVLLNAAVPPERFEWISDAVISAKRAGVPGRFKQETRSYLFNIHSFNDTPNRVLFRLASAFNDDPSTCAAGACGVARYATLCVDDSGKLQPLGAASRALQERVNVWNVDATRVVFDHTDIYKGRIASLVSDLIYSDEKAKWPDAPEFPETENRCDMPTADRRP